MDFLSVSPRLERKVTFPIVRRQDPLVQWAHDWVILCGVSLASSYPIPVTGASDSHMAHCLLVKPLSWYSMDSKGLCLPPTVPCH